jgi:hypothetical protein
VLGVLFGVICKTAPDLDFIPIQDMLPREFKVNPDGPILGTERIAIFLVVIACFFFACANVARELVAERPVFMREARAGLKPGPYLGAVFVWQALLATIQAMIITSLVWSIVGLKTSALVGAITLVSLTAMSGIAVGLVISAVSKTEVTAVSWVPLVLIPQMILAGVLKPYHALGAGKAISALIPARWGFESIQRHLYSQYRYSNATESAEQMTHVCKEFADCSGVISVTKESDPHALFNLLPGNPGYPDATVMECAMGLVAAILSMYLVAYLLVRRQAE